jgi:Concanavalin A-like lectin/glucanases superfamily
VGSTRGAGVSGRRLVVVTVLGLLAQAGMVGVAVAAHAAPPPQRASTAEPAAELVASASAKTAGHRVEVTDRRSESSQVFANPDGSFTASLSSRPVRVRRGDGSWAPVDTTLRRVPDGSIQPVATPMALRLSGGGEGALVSMSREGRSVGMTWPGRLPAPSLAGDTATYAEVMPGVDLRVRATLDGFSDVLVVKTPAASKTLRRVRLGLRTGGATARIGKAGELSAVDSGGRQVFAAPAAMMWDSATTSPTAAAQRRAGAPAASSYREPGAGARKARLPARLDGANVEVVPDAALLARGHFPVYIDPETTFNMTGWTEVNAYTANSVWRTADNRPASGQAYDEFGTYRVRSFFGFGTAPVRNAHIFSAFFRIYLQHSWSCRPRPVELWLMASGAGPNTTWDTQPSFRNATWLNTLREARGYTGCAPGQISFDATRGVAKVAAAGGTSLTFGLKAGDESDVYGWKKYEVATASVVPQLDVSYDFAPNQLRAGDLSTTQPATSCVGAANAPRINVPSTGMTLRARATDPDGTQNKLRVNYEWGALSGSAVTLLSRTTSAQANPGTTFTVTLPRSTLSRGDTTYAWHANVQDINPDTGAVMTTTAWSPWCMFTLDTTKPNAPNITGYDYPDGELADGHVGGIGHNTIFTIDANGSTDVVKYIWSINQDRGMSGTVLGTSAGAPNLIWITTDTPGLNKLYVRSVDAAGNTQAASVAWEFVVPDVLTQPDAMFDFDNAIGDDSSENTTTTPAGGATLVPGKVGNALHLDGTGTVDTQEFVRLYDNYTISAWVRLADTSTTRTVWSIDTPFADGNELQAGLAYRAATHRWVVTLRNAGSPLLVQSTSTPIAGQWYYLTVSYNASHHPDPSPGGLGQIATLMVNGQTEATALFTTDTGDFPFHIGYAATADNTASQLWNGDIDELRVTNRRGTPTEISQLAHWALNGNGDDESGLGRPVMVTAPAGANPFGPDDFGDSALVSTAAAPAYAATAGPVVRTDASFTVAAWVDMADKNAPSYTAVSQFGTKNSAFMLRYRKDKDRWTVDLPTNDSAATWTSAGSNAAPQSGTWTQLVMRYDASTHTVGLYVGTDSSVPVLAQEVSFTAWNATGPLNIGRSRWQGAISDSWSGSIDDVRVWGDALTDNEITNLF